MEDSRFNDYLAHNEQVQKAYVVAQFAHQGQMRKWTPQPEPYIVHPRRVANTVYNYLITCNCTTYDIENSVCAAFLHDVIEDTDYPEKKLLDMFGNVAYNLVVELTDPPFEEGASRDYKLGVNVKRWYHLSRFASVIKVADRYDNLQDAGYAPKKWLAKYLVESSILNAILGPRSPSLAAELRDRIENLKKVEVRALTMTKNGV